MRGSGDHVFGDPHATIYKSYVWVMNGEAMKMTLDQAHRACSVGVIYLLVVLNATNALAPTVPAPGSVTVGDPANPTGLAQAIQNAYIRGERHIVITPGAYFLANPGEAQIQLNHWRDAILSAHRVTLILDNARAKNRVILMDHCVNVTLEGPLLTQTSQTAYQGRVTAIVKDSGGKPTCDWRPSIGCPVPSLNTKELWINVVDTKTRTINIQAGDYYHAKIEPLNDGLYHIHLEDRPIRFGVGDWIVARYGNPPNKVFLSRCRDCTVKDNGDGTSTLTLDSAETIPLDARLSNPLYTGRGYKIIGCRLGNTRSRGIIVKSDDGLIKDNMITHCGLAIRIGPEWPDEADYSQHVVVEGNTIRQNGDGIVVDGSGVKQNRDITIKNNRVISNGGDAISVAWADGVTILGNTIAAPSTWPAGAEPKPPVSVRDSQNVGISGNQIMNPHSFAHPFVKDGVNVGQLTQDTGK